MAVEAAIHAHHYTRTAHSSATVQQNLSKTSSTHVHQKTCSSLHLTPSYQHIPNISQAAAQRTVSGGRSSQPQKILRASLYHVTVSRSGRPPTPDSWEHGKGSWGQTLRAHTALSFPLGILHSPPGDMHSQD